MLDDLKFIHERDSQDALGVAEKQWQQLQHEFEIESMPTVDSFQNVVFAGMGGSALAALIAQTWPGFTKPFEIVRNYYLPEYVNSASLFFASSYSGNTEETLSALADAESRNAKIIVIASGGRLAEIAEEKNYPLLKLPKHDQPRYAVLYSLKALLTATDLLKLTTKKAAELAAQADFLKQAVGQWLPTVSTSQNQAKQIAHELMGKSIVVYSGPKLYPAAYKWKISFNENAKHIAWLNQYPEFNHNEMLGWTKQPTNKPYAVLELRSELEHLRVQKRFEVASNLLSGLRPEPLVINPKGNTILEQLLWTIALGDFTSLYLALLNNLNPTPVKLVEKFKIALDQ